MKTTERFSLSPCYAPRILPAKFLQPEIQDTASDPMDDDDARCARRLVLFALFDNECRTAREPLPGSRGTLSAAQSDEETSLTLTDSPVSSSTRTRFLRGSLSWTSTVSRQSRPPRNGVEDANHFYPHLCVILRYHRSGGVSVTGVDNKSESVRRKQLSTKDLDSTSPRASTTENKQKQGNERHE